MKTQELSLEPQLCRSFHMPRFSASHPTESHFSSAGIFLSEGQLYLAAWLTGAYTAREEWLMVVVLSQEEMLTCRPGENAAFHDVEHCEKSDNILSDHQTRLLIGKK